MGEQVKQNDFRELDICPGPLSLVGCARDAYCTCDIHMVIASYHIEYSDAIKNYQSVVENSVTRTTSSMGFYNQARCQCIRVRDLLRERAIFSGDAVTMA